MELAIETRPTYTLGVRLQPELIEGIDRYVEARGATRSIVARALIKHALESLKQEENQADG